MPSDSCRGAHVPGPALITPLVIPFRAPVCSGIYMPTCFSSSVPTSRPTSEGRHLLFPRISLAARKLSSVPQCSQLWIGMMALVPISLGCCEYKMN